MRDYTVVATIVRTWGHPCVYKVQLQSPDNLMEVKHATAQAYILEQYGPDARLNVDDVAETLRVEVAFPGHHDYHDYRGWG